MSNKQSVPSVSISFKDDWYQYTTGLIFSAMAAILANITVGYFTIWLVQGLTYIQSNLVNSKSSKPGIYLRIASGS